MSNVEHAIEAIKRGEMVIILDDESRENEGDLVVSAECITPIQMAFLIRHTGGVVCLSLSNKLADQIDLPPMVARNTSHRQTAFTVSIEAAEGITTGISAQDRVTTIRAAVNKSVVPNDLHRPGHVFPLRAKDGGVLWRGGHTEASVDLCVLAGLRPAAVISELIHEDGTMMRQSAIEIFAREHKILVTTVADLIAYRHKTESFISLEAKSTIQTTTGEWDIRIYRDELHDAEQVALVKGDVTVDLPVLVRVHSECFTGDVVGSQHCDCGEQLSCSMKKINEVGRGVVLYMKQEGRGIGLVNKIKAYKLQHDEGLDTSEANRALGFPEDLREYGIGAQILKDLGLHQIRLMTNNPKKLAGIEGYGLDIVEQVPIEVKPNGVNNGYLRTKRDKMGHTLKIV
jgi:3,4-dihydroxy 2-butanone 4-phosphate synthase / GTP cyclohydrolase II